MSATEHTRDWWLGMDDGGVEKPAAMSATETWLEQSRLVPWEKVHLPQEELPWLVVAMVEGHEFIKAHCYHEADADTIIADHNAVQQLAEPMVKLYKENLKHTQQLATERATHEKTKADLQQVIESDWEIARSAQKRADEERATAERLAAALTKAMGYTVVGENFIQKLVAPGNVEAVAQIMHLNDLRQWMEETRPLLAAYRASHPQP